MNNARCNRVPAPEEVADLGGCGCRLLFGMRGLVCPSPYSDDFLTHCSRCGLSIVSWTDDDANVWMLCRCGLGDDEEWRKADAEIDEYLDAQEGN